MLKLIMLHVVGWQTLNIYYTLLVYSFSIPFIIALALLFSLL